MKVRLILVVRVIGVPGRSATIDNPPFIPEVGDSVEVPNHPEEMVGVVERRNVEIAANAITTVTIYLRREPAR